MECPKNFSFFLYQTVTFLYTEDIYWFMLLTEFVDLLNEIENEPSTNKKIKLIKPHITNPFLLTLLTMPAINVGDKTILKTLAKHTGYDIKEVQAEYIFDGRVSTVVEIMLGSRRTTELGHFFKIKSPNKNSDEKENVDLIQVYALIMELSNVTGFSKQSALLHTLFNMSNSSQVINIITGDRPIGIKKKNIFKALPGKTSEIAKAYALCNNWFLLCSSIEKLSEIEPLLFTPISSQLCQSQPIDDYKIKSPVVIDTKYDGVRIQVHCKEDRVEIYTRMLENKTLSMPDFIKSIQEWRSLNIDFSGIFDMELLPHTTKNGQFIRLDQEAVITRMGKHNIHQKMKEVQLDARIFDIMMLNGEVLIDKPYYKRRDIIKNFEYTRDIKLTDIKLITSDKEFKEVFFDVTKHHEGVVVKLPESKYIPGDKGSWLKIKPLLPTFDFIITKAFYGKGKNAGLYSSFEISALLSNGELRAIGKVGIGFSDGDMEKLADEINSQAVDRMLDHVEIANPRMIVEVACEKVNLIRGHVSLDFARKISIRTDKDDITTIEELKKFVGKT